MDTLLASYGTLRPITSTEARAAKLALRPLLAQHPWFRGITTGSDAFGSFVRVNVSARTSEVMATIPARWHGVPVYVEAVGEIGAQ